MDSHLLWLLAFVASAFVGSLPFGYWLALTKGVDLRRVGSGNIGATNAWRACGPAVGLPVLLLDVAKGFLPTFAAKSLFAQDELLAALLVGCVAVIGHAFSPFLRFKGGKGVATALGVVLAATPDVAGCGLVAWLVAFALTRIVSFSSLAGLAAAVISAGFFGYPGFIVWGYGVLALLIAWLHRENIRRLVQGQEYKFGGKSDKSAGELNATGGDESTRRQGPPKSGESAV